MCEKRAWGLWRVCGAWQATWSRPSQGSQECTGCIARKRQPPPSWAHPRTCNRARASPYISRWCSTQGSATERACGCAKRPPVTQCHPGIQTAQVVLGHQLGTCHTHPRLGCHAHTLPYTSYVRGKRLWRPTPMWRPDVDRLSPTSHFIHVQVYVLSVTGAVPCQSAPSIHVHMSMHGKCARVVGTAATACTPTGSGNVHWGRL